MIESYLADEVAEVQALLMHGRIVKPDDAKSSVRVLARYLQSLVDAEDGGLTPAADSEEAMRAQQAAEQLLGPPVG